MLQHYLKIAFRNMWKYKGQTLISIVGLAVGFTCFTLATLWIVYEMTYDSFHRDAEQMYVVYKPDLFSPTGYDRRTHNPLPAYLKEIFPEVADAILLIPSYPESTVTVEDVRFPASVIQADSSFFRMFDVKIIEGNRDFLIPKSKNIAITQKKAQQLFGNKSPIGEKVDTWGEEFTICAVVSGLPKKSNYPFDFIMPFYNIPKAGDEWYVSYGGNTIIKLIPGTNIEAFEKKLYDHDFSKDGIYIKELKINPITKMRYIDSNIQREVKFQYILIFSLSGLLVVLCSLFNYLTLFVSRFRLRQKELALRVVCGASGGSLLTLLSVEFILTLLLAVVLGCLLTQLVHKSFLSLSGIQMDLPAIYLESLMYIGGIILVSLLIFWLILFIFRRKSLNLSIRRSNKKLFRKISVIVQLVISIGFAFCTIVILKQMYFLHHTNELGFSFQNRATIEVSHKSDGVALEEKLKQIPGVMEVVNTKGLISLVPQRGRMASGVSSWDDKPDDAERISLEKLYVSPEYIDFYDFRLIAGEMLTDSDPDSLVLLNESAVKAFGWHDAVGKRFDNGKTVKGVIRNVYNFAPTIEAKPTCYLKRSPKGGGVSMGGGTNILFKYEDGMWKSCKEKIDKLIKEEFNDSNDNSIFNTEEEYNKFLKSENALIKLLSFVSAICVLICVFGFISLVSLTCEERRKDIAIRKINGATSGNILAIFAKEYFLLLMIGALIAFPASFFIIQRWLELYVKQTSIPAWIYLSIIFVLALVIVLCVGRQVYKASTENPAEVVKGE